MFQVEECPLRRLAALEPHVTLAVALASPETWYGAAHVLSLLGTVNLRAFVASWSLFGGACAALWIASIYDQYREGALFLTSSGTGAAAGAAGAAGRTAVIGVSRARRRSLIRICSYSVFLLGSACLYLSMPVARWLLSSALSTKLRAEPYPIAVELFEELEARGRVVRIKGWYDLYLPPSLSLLPDDSDTCVPSGDDTSIAEEERESSGHEPRTCPQNDEGRTTGTPPRPRLMRGLIFYPGALVPHVAYSTVASLISDRGVVAAVPDMEPFRRPWGRGGLGASFGDAERIAADAETRIRRLLFPPAAAKGDGRGEELLENEEDPGTPTPAQGPIDIEWSVGGHSMGGYAAMWIALDQQRRQRRKQRHRNSSSHSSSSSSPVVFGKVVTWGAATGPDSMFGGFVPDLRRDGDGGGGKRDRTPFPVRVLAVLGSNDEFAGFKSPEDEAFFRARMPPDPSAPTAAAESTAISDAEVGEGSGSSSLTVRVIEGGNHAGFASYDNGDAGGRGRTIRWREQHRAAANLTADFLLDR